MKYIKQCKTEVVSQETGELMDEFSNYEVIKTSKNIKWKDLQKEIDECSDINLKLKKILNLLYNLNQVNPCFYDQYRINVNGEKEFTKYIERKVEEYKKYTKYISNIKQYVKDFTRIIIFNNNVKVSSWEDIYKLAEISNKKNQISFKKFCIEYGIIAKFTRELMNKKDVTFCFNPMFQNQDVFIGELACYTFKELLKKYKALHPYVFELIDLKYKKS